MLITEGQPLEALYVVLEGRLRVRVGDTELAELGPGEVVGELSLLDARPPAATVETGAEEALVLSVPRSFLQRRLLTDEGFAARFYHAVGLFLAERLRATVLRLGYGDGERATLDELDEEQLDQATLAGSRFDWLLQRLRGR